MTTHFSSDENKNREFFLLQKKQPAHKNQLHFFRSCLVDAVEGLIDSIVGQLALSTRKLVFRIFGAEVLVLEAWI